MPHTHANSRGFTLIELVTAMAISTILFLALGSAIVVASRAIPTGTEPVITEGEINRGLALMASDIELATDVSRVGNTLVIKVPDRDGDAASDTIIYSWSGADRMMTRSWNGSDAEDLFGPLTIAMPVITKEDGYVKRVLFVLQLSGHQPPTRTLNIALLNTPEDS